MRIYFRTTPNTQSVPFNYQQSIVGVLHKWLGNNEWHDRLSLYSLSWLSGGAATKEALNFSNGAVFFLSTPDPDLLNTIISGVQQDPAIRWGMKVREMQLCRTPEFRQREHFFLKSPVLIKRTLANRKVQYFFPEDEPANKYLSETLRNKLSKAGMEELDVQVRFDETFENPKTKLVEYNGIQNKATFCPVILEGDPRAISFAWDVGVGNCTGIGFGALK